MLISPSLNPAKLFHGPPSFITCTVKVQVSVLTIPDKIYPCFQHIWHCFILLISLSLNPAKLSHGPLSFYYQECKCLNQCFHCSLWDLPLFTTHMTLLDDAYITYPQPSQIVPWLSLSFHYPCFQHIWHFFMMLMASRFVLAISCHGLPSFHYQDCNFQISVMVFPDEIYPCFQLIWHCLMMLISPSLNQANLSHGPPNFPYQDCKCSNQCFDCSRWDLPFNTYDIVSWCLYHLASTQPNCAMALRVFFPISIFIVPEEITPVFQLIWQCYMMLKTSRVDSARSGHGPQSF